MFDMDPFGGKKVPCTKYQKSGITAYPGHGLPGFGSSRSLASPRQETQRIVAMCFKKRHVSTVRYISEQSVCNTLHEFEANHCRVAPGTRAGYGAGYGAGCGGGMNCYQQKQHNP